MVNTQMLQGQWNQVRGQLKKKWSQLSEDDLRFTNGNIDQLIGRIQHKTGPLLSTVAVCFSVVVPVGVVILVSSLVDDSSVQPLIAMLMPVTMMPAITALINFRMSIVSLTELSTASDPRTRSVTRRRWHDHRCNLRAESVPDSKNAPLSWTGTDDPLSKLMIVYRLEYGSTLLGEGLAGPREELWHYVQLTAKVCGTAGRVL
jgi:uncharacterized protein YjbJ (UPF0337 family)